MIGQVRSMPILSLTALREIWREHKGGFGIEEDHEPHLEAALEWLKRAQDATPDAGVARGYSLIWHPYFKAQGWQPSYPETTGYIIPTLYESSRRLGDGNLAERATLAARWLVGLQLSSGAIAGGVIGQEQTPAIFNTGQVIFGWLSAFIETGESEFADAVLRAGEYLLSTLDPDGIWRKENSIFADPRATLYNTRAAWALAEAGLLLKRPDFLLGARANLSAVANLQRENGWFPNCCLTDPENPLLHTLAYTIRGLLEGGRILDDARLVRSAESAAERLLDSVAPSGWMPGRYRADWTSAVPWSCLTGQAQMVNNWIRLYEIGGDPRWLTAVPRVLRFVKTTQNRTSSNPGIRGGIRGAAPISGDYGRYEVLNWATKFFVDALIRDEQIKGRAVGEGFWLA